MRAAVIEDNELDLEHLKILLKGFSECELAGCAADMSEGLALIRRERPELIFLDVQVGGQNSLDRIGQLDYEPFIICMTLYDSHALKAYDVGAVDYLTKPLTEAKLARALRRVSLRAKHSQSAPDTVLIKSGGSTRVVPVDHIQMIQGERDYTSVLLAGESLLCGQRMRDWRELLPPARFIQLDRSTIVNREQIETFSRATRSARGSIKLHGGRRIDIGMTASRKLQELFQ